MSTSSVYVPRLTEGMTKASMMMALQGLMTSGKDGIRA